MDTPTASKAESTGTGLKVLQIVRRVFIYLLSAGVIIAALLFAASNSPNKSLFGYRYYTVLTPSMEPTYSVGEMVFVKLEKADNINVGDVITFNPSSGSESYLTHRVAEKYTDYQGSGVTCFRTKGDANDTKDQFLIDESRVIGVVKLGIPLLGYIVRFVQLRWYFVLPLIVLIFVFFKLLGMYLAPPPEGESSAGGTEEKPSVEEITSSEEITSAEETPSIEETAYEDETPPEEAENEKENHNQL
ncbi:MAG: signal peptidase I [Ruminococcus sp.]|nr:signal peptidase I [Ruminococcus sp.]